MNTKDYSAYILLTFAMMFLIFGFHAVRAYFQHRQLSKLLQKKLMNEHARL